MTMEYRMYLKFLQKPRCLGWFKTAALKHRVRNPESGNGNGNGIRERRFQAIDLKKKISNDKKINKQIK